MADVEENVATEPKEDTEKQDETTEETKKGDEEEETENLNSNTEDIHKSKPDSESGPPKSSSNTTANNSSRSKEMDSVVQPLLTGKAIIIILRKQRKIVSLSLCMFTISEYRFIPNNNGVRLLEIWKNGR